MEMGRGGKRWAGVALGGLLWVMVSLAGWGNQGPTGGSWAGAIAPNQPAQELHLTYPPPDHVTTSDRIFLIGTADPRQPVTLNGAAITPRSPHGHFAPSIPLALGVNPVTLTQGDQTIALQIQRVSPVPPAPEGASFGAGSLVPQEPWERPQGEVVCLGAIAPAGATVTVTLGGQTLPLLPQTRPALPSNAAALVAEGDPLPVSAPRYEHCFQPPGPGPLGQPEYTLTWQGRTHRELAPGTLTIRPAVPTTVATVTVPQGVTRTGPSTDHSRLTPLPQGTQAAVTARQGDWIRLDYGAWIRQGETRLEPGTPPGSVIRSVRAQVAGPWTEVRFPLEMPVPFTLTQGTGSLTLTLHNTLAQTDTIPLTPTPALRRLDWTPLLGPGAPQAQYTFHLTSPQPWGYRTRYEGSTLVLGFRHPPTLALDSPRPLTGATILLDPGHGGPEDLGARGPNGYPEKAVALAMSQQVRQRLEGRGARVVMTRETDEDVSLGDRVGAIAATAPTLALSLHYNALPDNGDALNTAGIGMFWFHPQAHDLAVFLHDFLTTHLDRPSYGVFWNNLALTRPTTAPSLLLELGFMINPTEFEWIVDPTAQAALADALTDGIETWLRQMSR